MLTAPTPDGIFPYLLLLNPVYFGITTPLVLLIEGAILWKMGFGSIQQVSLYSVMINVASGIAGFVIYLLMFPYLTASGPAGFPTFSLLFFPCFMGLIWLGMLIFSIIVEEFVMNRLVPNHPHIRQAIVICNIVSYLLIAVLFPLFVESETISYDQIAPGAIW